MNKQRERLTTDKTKIFVRENITLMSVTKDELRRHYNEIFDRLQEYEVAEENGQIILPPCRVGDKVYYVSENPLNLSVQANTIYEADVVRIVTTSLGTSLAIQIRNEYGCTEIPDVKDWGKTVFPTKEEALSKLQASCKQVKGGVDNAL